MRVERQGRKIHIALKQGNQERWFNIEESEAQELALKLGEVLSEPKKPKFVVGDRVRIIEDTISRVDSYLGEIVTIEEVLLGGKELYVKVNDWVWAQDWLEKVGEAD